MSELVEVSLPTKPHLLFTMTHTGKSSDWHTSIRQLEKLLRLAKNGILSEELFRTGMIQFIRLFYTDVNDSASSRGSFQIICTHHLLCKILDGKNIRIFSDGSSE